MKKIYAEMVADLFHYGHVEFLCRARALGDHLTVGILSDEWAAAHKTPPVIPWRDRARVVAACRHVDAVLLQAAPVDAAWLAEHDFIHAIALKDETDRARHRDTSIGHDPAREVELPYEHGVSTSTIIRRIEDRAAARQAETALIRRYFAPRWRPGEWLLAEQMLIDLGRILDANAILWFLAFGSHLGAVRHGGVIPWDDDIDIAIREADEARLADLAPTLHAAGYNIVRYTTTSGMGTEIYYKLWIAKRPSATDRAHSWPFIDIFILRPDAADPGRCGLDHRMFPAADIFPLAQAAFGSQAVPVPRNPDLLATLYDAAYRTRCFSTSYIHRTESLAEKTIGRPAGEVIAAGCFVAIHQAAQKLLAATPVRAEGWKLDEASWMLSRGPAQTGQTAIRCDSLLAALWHQLDGQRPVSAIGAVLQGPPIEILRAVLDHLEILETAGAIRLVYPKQ